MPLELIYTTEAVAQQPLRAFIYNRNSVGKHGRSTDDTNLENHRLCEARGWIVAGVFFDRGISASRHSTKTRDDWEAMLERTRNGECDVIVLWESSRGYRNTRAFLDLRDLCERTGVLLCYNGRVFNMRNRSDRFMAGFDAMRNEDEVDAIKERNQRTARINAERGRPHGKNAYGWRREYDPDTGVLLRQIPDAAQAAVVQEISERVASGHSCRSIAKRLNETGVQPPAGLPWSGLTVRQLVLRPGNIGQRTHRGQVIGKASWDAIVDEATYIAARKVLTDPSRLTHHDNAVKHLMSGVGLCGACHRDPEPVNRAVKATVRGSYQCPCARASIRREWFDQTVETTLLEYVSRPEFAASLRAKDGDGVAAALAEAQALEEQLTEARALAATFENGKFLLSAKSLASMEQELMPRIEAAQARAMDLAVPAVVRRAAGPGAWTVWHEELDLAEKRTVIRSVVKVYLNPPGRGARKPRPEFFTWDWLR